MVRFAVPSIRWKGDSMDIIEKKEYSFSDDTGDVVLTVYTVFPGIKLIYNSVHIDHFDLGTPEDGKYIEIHHCREGRIEKEFEYDNLCLMPGDLSIAVRNQMTSACSFPLHYYHGITITIDIDAVPECFAQLLDDVCVKPLTVAQRLCHEKKCCILRAETDIEHIFSELYSAPEKGRIGYFKVKILELFLLLNEIDGTEDEAAETLMPRSKVDLARQVADYLTEHINRHITIPEVAKQFSVSDSYLKHTFKEVFGVPIYSYIRSKKMQIAAKWLVNSDRPILQIANECGYGNGSKFTAAFHDVMGETPSNFRKRHTKRSD